MLWTPHSVSPKAHFMLIRKQARSHALWTFHYYSRACFKQSTKTRFRRIIFWILISNTSWGSFEKPFMSPFCCWSHWQKATPGVLWFRAVVSESSELGWLQHSGGKTDSPDPVLRVSFNYAGWSPEAWRLQHIIMLRLSGDHWTGSFPQFIISRMHLLTQFPFIRICMYIDYRW